VDLAERRVAADGRAEVELGPALEWFDPDLAALLQVNGRLVLAGSGSATPGAGGDFAIDHIGGPLRGSLGRA
jgi:hypothetical protein